MQVDIIPIGNSKGIRIPKAFLEQCGFTETADITLKDNRLVLTPTAKLRSGWEDAFKAMASLEEDTLMEFPPDSFDRNQWQW